jgi:predicted glycogen debranching enzyme
MRVDLLEQTDRATCLAGDFDAQLGCEWLITNGRGGYASGTVLSIPTRRYHGLLVAAARPPLERWLLLSSVLERVGIDQRYYELAGFEFPDALHPRGFELLTDFCVNNNLEAPWVRFVYQFDRVRLAKYVILPYGRDEVLIRYKLEGPAGVPLSLALCPFTAMRDFHSLTHAFEGGFAVDGAGAGVAVAGAGDWPRLSLNARRLDGGATIGFAYEPCWWCSFVYREEGARGQEDREDLFVPGWFRTQGADTVEVELSAVAGFSGDGDPAPAAEWLSVVQVPAFADRTVEDRLRQAADAFVVSRLCEDGRELTTILAGYHWFGDWGRDTFIALPGLLLETGRFDEARRVLEVFASSQQNGLIPNRFSDYGEGRDYNSVDASLWFVHAAVLYCDLTKDESAWREVLGPACDRVVDAFVGGTLHNIHVAEDGLVWCGNEGTQLTWMDAKCGDEVFTPRHGKPVEINALWYHILCAMARRTGSYNSHRAAYLSQLASDVRQVFWGTYWNEMYSCLYDVVRDDWHDLAVRPNQIFAVSLPYSPLARGHQEAVVSCVERELLTPYGLRSLGPDHPSYRGRYEGGPFERDSVYHQGTVWGWLIGPFVEAYLRVHDFSPVAKSRMREQLLPLIDHLEKGGIGYISEIFDGDEPHTPRGCIGQAWSVAELLRAWHMTEPD